MPTMSKFVCTVKIVNDKGSQDIVEEDLNITLPDNFSDEKIYNFFSTLRQSLKQKHIDVILEHVQVEIKLAE
jgi:hypothetical protein